MYLHAYYKTHTVSSIFFFISSLLSFSLTSTEHNRFLTATEVGSTGGTSRGIKGLLLSPLPLEAPRSNPGSSSTGQPLTRTTATALGTAPSQKVAAVWSTFFIEGLCLKLLLPKLLSLKRFISRHQQNGFGICFIWCILWVTQQLMFPHVDFQKQADVR